MKKIILAALAATMMSGVANAATYTFYQNAWVEAVVQYESSNIVKQTINRGPNGGEQKPLDTGPSYRDDPARTAPLRVGESVTLETAGDLRVTVDVLSLPHKYGPMKIEKDESLKTQLKGTIFRLWHENVR